MAASSAGFFVALVLPCSSAAVSPPACQHKLGDACQRCKSAGGGLCKPIYHWSWHASLSENERSQSHLHGLPGVRGTDAVNAAGVKLISIWNQSNWPAIIRAAPGIVSAASETFRQMLCTLWEREHSYQSWPVLLNCPGRRAEEYEPPCANVGAIVRIPCASVDLTGDATIAGGIYDADRWFRVAQSVHPPDVCAARQAVEVGDIGVALSVYPTAIGHFVPEQLPKVMLLHSNLPPTVPIVVADGPVVRRYLEPLLASGVAQPGRFRFTPLRQDGTVLQASSVYTVLNSHFSNVIGGDMSYQVVRAAYSPNGPVAPTRRSTIILVDRGRSKPRSMDNIEQVKQILQAAAGKHGAQKHERGGRVRAEIESGDGALRVVTWTPNSKNVSADIEVFQHAAMIVAPHGAGLANMMFAAEGTPVIEVCYDSQRNPNARGMFCPSMYGAMAANLHMPYWVITGRGDYITAMKVDLPQLELAAQAALEIVAAMRAGHARTHGNVGVRTTADGDGNVAGLVRRLKATCRIGGAAGAGSLRQHGVQAVLPTPSREVSSSPKGGARSVFQQTNTQRTGMAAADFVRRSRRSY